MLMRTGLKINFLLLILFQFPFWLASWYVYKRNQEKNEKWERSSQFLYAKLSAFRLMVLMFSIFNTLVLESHPTQNKQNAKIYNFWWKSFFVPLRSFCSFEFDIWFSWVPFINKVRLESKVWNVYKNTNVIGVKKWKVSQVTSFINDARVLIKTLAPLTFISFSMCCWRGL